MNDEHTTSADPETPGSARAPAAEAGAPAVGPPGPAGATDTEAPPPRSGFTVNDRRFWATESAEEESAAERAQAPTYVAQLQTDLAEKDRQLREYIAAYKQEVVEGLEKTKQRLERDAAQRLELLRGQLVEPMLEVLDALDRSLAAAATGSSLEALVRGVTMVRLLMLQKLQALGLQRMESVGQPFDPGRHEAVSVVQVTDPAQENRVIDEIQTGYTLGERLVRPAQVRVGKRAR